MKNNKKLNNGCLKIFYFLRLLYEDRAYYSDVVDIFKDEINEQSANNIQVTLNKYINTLKVFGIKIKKVNNKYNLMSSLYSVQFTLEDLKSISILASGVKNFPDKELSEEINSFIHSITLRMSNEDKTTLSMLGNSLGYDFSFFYLDIRKQIEDCEKLCKENQLLDLIYLKDNHEVRSTCVAKEIIYDSKNAYLRVHDSVKRQSLEIPINDILHIAMLPNRTSNVELNTTVVYKIKGRLSKTYKLKEYEVSQGYDADGNLVVVNRNEPFEKLLSRLMKYTTSCELVSPKYLRDDMIKLISDSLSNYGE